MKIAHLRTAFPQYLGKLAGGVQTFYAEGANLRPVQSTDVRKQLYFAVTFEFSCCSVNVLWITNYWVNVTKKTWLSLKDTVIMYCYKMSFSSITVCQVHPLSYTHKTCWTDQPHVLLISITLKATLSGLKKKADFFFYVSWPCYTVIWG